MTQLDILGRIAFVTGAAGGIGRAMTRLLLENDVTVIAVDHDKSLLDTLKLEIDTLRADDKADIRAEYKAGIQAESEADFKASFNKKTLPQVHYFELDVRNTSEVKALIDQCESEIGEIDICANLAGVLTTGLAVDTEESEWDKVFDINAKGVFNVSSAIAKYMIGRKRGNIVTVSSNAAGIPRHGMAAYAASKAAATMFTKSLGLELAPHGIRCNVVAPGSTRTPMQESMWNDTTNESSVIAGAINIYKTGIPLQKIAEPIDIANAVLFLLSAQASHITMTDIYVDGGATLRA